MAYTDYLETVQKIYVAYYQRPADPEGLLYWAAKIDAADGSLDEIIDSFANSEEAKALYGEINEETIGNVIDAIYQAAFNRAADESGKQYYIEGFKEGKFTAGSIAVDILNGAQGEDKVTLENKLESAMAFTKAIDPELDGKNILATYAGEEDAQAAREFLKDVGFSPATLKTKDDAVSFIKEKIADQDDPIVQVTSGGYEFSMNTDILVGTSNDDNFTAPVTVNTIGNSVDTFQTQDVADGGDGNDVLTATILGSALGTTYAPKLANIETLDIRALNNATFDFANSEGVEKFVNDGSIGNVTLKNIPAMIEVDIKNVKGNQTTIDYLNSVLTGSSDAQKIVLDNTTEGHKISLGLAGNGPEAIEELDISAVNNKSVVEIDNAKNIKQLKVDGDAGLKITFGDADSKTVGVNPIANLKTFDASENKGGVTADLATNVAASNITVTGSSADDKITLANVDDKDSVDLGDGDDTLIISGVNADVNKTVTLKNAENIYFAKLGANNKIFNMSGADSVKTIGVVSNATGRDIKVTKVGDTLNKIELNAAGNPTGTGAISGINVAATNALTNTDDSVDLFVTNKDQNGNLLDPGAGTQFNANVTVTNFENVNISTESLGANKYNTDGTINQAGGVNIKLNDTALETLKIKSDYYVDVTGGNINTATTIKNVDASATTAGVKIDVSAAADSNSTGTKVVNVTGGSGNDDITFGVNANTVKIVGGDGHDTLKLAAGNITGNLTIDAGNGNDTIDVSADTAPAGDTANVVRIITGDGTDTVKLNDNGSENIQLLDFTPGGSGDVIDLAANNANDGGTKLVNYAEIDSSTTAAPNNAGLVVVTNTVTDADSSGAIELDEILQSGAGGSFAAAGDSLYVVYTDGSDSYLAYAVEVGGNGVDAGDTVTTVATFAGVSDTSQFDANNFADFIA